MTPAGFEPTVSADKRPQTYALDRAAAGTGGITFLILMKFYFFFSTTFICTYPPV